MLALRRIFRTGQNWMCFILSNNDKLTCSGYHEPIGLSILHPLAAVVTMKMLVDVWAMP
jgi:hypothetical protein